jgi:dTMP kinase
MGTLIVIEGIDGSGKTTQFNLLCDALRREGHGFKRVSFPAYDEPSSALVRMYLDGQLGRDPDSVNPFAASAFFAVDRYASFKRHWEEYYVAGGAVITDRYATSNAIHQGAKLDRERRTDFFKWICQFEYEMMSLPSPDLVIYMDIPAPLAARRRQERGLATGETPDIHEQSLRYLERCADCGLEAAEHYGWRIIQCAPGGTPRSAEDIHGEISRAVGEILV